MNANIRLLERELQIILDNIEEVQTSRADCQKSREDKRKEYYRHLERCNNGECDQESLRPIRKKILFLDDRGQDLKKEIEGLQHQAEKLGQQLDNL